MATKYTISTDDGQREGLSLSEALRSAKRIYARSGNAVGIKSSDGKSVTYKPPQSFGSTMQGVRRGQREYERQVRASLTGGRVSRGSTGGGYAKTGRSG